MRMHIMHHFPFPGPDDAAEEADAVNSRVFVSSGTAKKQTPTRLIEEIQHRSLVRSAGPKVFHSRVFLSHEIVHMTIWLDNISLDYR